ncbi:MAG: hypothetical protein ABSE82_04810 [Nitrososphaerales archaeon]
MKVNSKKIAAFTAIFLVIGMSLFSMTNLATIRASSASNVNGYNVISAIWGTTAAPISAAPGDHPDQLQITLQYIFSATAQSIQGYLQLPTGFSLYNGSSVAYASTTGTYPTGSTITMNFQVYISSTLSLGSYIIPLQLSWTAAGYGYLLNDTVPVTVQIEGRPQLYFSYTSSALSAGVVNQVPISISNNGSGTASSIFITATSQGGGILNTVPEIQSLSAGSVTSQTLQVYVPVSAAGTVLTISLSAAYKDPYGNSQTAAQALNTYVSPLSQPKLAISTNVQVLTPGQTDTITITISNSGTLTLSQISTSLSIAPATITMLGTFPYIQILDSGSTLNEQLSLFIPSTVANSAVTITFTSTFVEPDGATGTASQTLGFYTSALVAPVTISTNTQALTPGQTNSIPITVTNGGTLTLSQIATSVSISPGTITMLGAFPEISSLNPSSSVSEQLNLYIPSTTASSAVTITFTSAFTEPSGATASVTQTLGFYTSAYTATNYNMTVTVLPVNTNVTAGQESKVFFELENTGTASVYTPTISLTVSSPLVIVANSSFVYQQVLASKNSMIYEVTLTSSPSATIGTYSGTITVVYSDQQGTQHTQTFAMGFILSGLITITAESETVTQSTRSLAISGTLLNEGTASAYYANVAACVLQTTTSSVSVSRTITTGAGFPNSTSFSTSRSVTSSVTSSSTSRSVTVTTTRSVTGFTGSFTGPGTGPGGGPSTTGVTGVTCPSSTATTYIGEIDPNSPIAFTASATYSPSNTSSSATLLIVITYRNTFGVTATQPINKQITLTPAAASTSIVSPTTSPKTSNDKEYVQYALYGVIAAVIASVVAGAIFVRRKNSSISPGEQKVV